MPKLSPSTLRCLTREDLVAMGTPAAKSELRRRGRDVSGKKLSDYSAVRTARRSHKSRKNPTDTMIPLRPPVSDFQYASDPQQVHWTSDPEYSYDTFWREKWGLPISISPTAGTAAWGARIGAAANNPKRNPRYWAQEPGVETGFLLEADSAPEALIEARRKSGRRRGNFDIQALGNPALEGSGPWHPDKQVIFTDMPTNAGPYLPGMFPYGQGGRKATYKNPRELYYVVVGERIESVWEYSQDAKDRLRVITTEEGVPPAQVKVLMHSTLVSRGVDPADKANWGYEPFFNNPRGQVLPFRGREWKRGKHGGYSIEERASLPDHAFLKPSTRSWPVSDVRHALIAIQYMTAGRGDAREYPTLVRRLAKHWPVNSKNADIWNTYAKHRSAIATRAGQKMPTVQSLKTSRQKAAANPRDR